MLCERLALFSCWWSFKVVISGELIRKIIYQTSAGKVKFLRNSVVRPEAYR
jgi:hypothetical protein